MTKIAEVTQVIKKRIANADHMLVGMPGERQLAEELGMSRTTVRSAVQQLVTQGVLVRHANGRLDVAQPTNGQSKKKMIAFASAGMVSADVGLWDEGVHGALEGQPVNVRPVPYVHWSDSALQEALARFDGMFFVAPAAQLPTWLTDKMRNSSCRVVILDQDESAAGLPSVTLFPPASERKLFDHLRRLGHQRIDCLNTQAEDAVISGRISEWKRYLTEYGLTGQMRTQTIWRPLESAYQVIREALREGRPVASALFCTTGPAAMGAMRALHEAGLKIGEDVSVCAVNGEGLGKYLLKTLTELESPPRALYLQNAVQWMLGDDEWRGPLLIQPQDVSLFEGESTGPAPASPIISPRPG